MAYFKVAHLLICLFWHVVTSPRLRNFFSMALPSRGFFSILNVQPKINLKKKKKIEISTTMAINYFPTNHGLSDTRIALWQFSTDHSSYSIAIEWEEEIYCVILFFFIFSFSFSSNASRDFFFYLLAFKVNENYFGNECTVASDWGHFHWTWTMKISTSFLRFFKYFKYCFMN